MEFSRVDCIPIYQAPTAAVKDTADLLIEHRKLVLPLQGAKKDVSDSPGLVDIAIVLVNFVLNLPTGK